MMSTTVSSRWRFSGPGHSYTWQRWLPAPTLLTPHSCWTRPCTQAGMSASRGLRATSTSWRLWSGTPHQSSACSWPASTRRPQSGWWLTLRRSPVIRALHHREFLDDVVPFITKVAEVVADVDIASAEELVWPMGTPARDMALAKVAMVAARPIPPGPGRSPSPSWVGPGRLRTRVGGSGRHLPRPQCWTTRNQTIYWKVRALTEIAIVMTRADSDRSVRMSDEAERFARTIADQGTLRAAASTSAEAAVGQTDPVQ